MDEIKPPPAVTAPTPIDSPVTAPETPRRPQLTPLAVQLIASLKRLPPELRPAAMEKIRIRLQQSRENIKKTTAQKLAESKD